MPSDYSFQSIRNRFLWQVLWCVGLGVLLGLIYRTGTPALKQELLDVLGEQSSPKTFHAVGVLVMLSLGTAIAIFGRQAQPSAVRVFLCYRPAEVALALCAVFVGLLFGFGVGVGHPPISWDAVIAFFFSGFLLLGMLWLSFHGNGVQSEIHARLGAIVFAASSVGVLWWTYLR